VVKRTNRLFTGIVTVLVAGSALAACGSSSGSASGDKSATPTITLYSGQHEQTTAKLVKTFEAESGIHVKVRSDDEAVLANQIETEGSHSPADVFYTENTPPLEFLQEHNLLAPLTASTLAAVDSKYNSTQGEWVGVSARVNVMVYNTDKLQASQLPKSVMDLASPQWKGKLGIAPGETDFQPIVTSIMKEKGKSAALAWLEAIKSNAGSHSYPDNESLTDMVNRGQVQIGLINHYYWYRQRDEVGAKSTHSAIAFFAPHDVGYVLDVSGAAVLKSSKNQAAAQKLVAFLVSHNGEEVLAHSESYEYPLGSGVVTAKPLKPFGQLQPIALSLSDLGDGSASIALLQQVQLL
jgi:iron(III) transport system substrate-binding protein